MTMDALFPRMSLLRSTVAFALLLGVANATAITKAPSRGTNAVPAKVSVPVATPLHLTTNLTPAATVSVPTSRVLGDIRDIRQPRHFPTPWLWVGMAAGVVILITAAYAAWQWLQHGKYFEMTPGEIALQRLAEARRLMDPDEAREYCFAVSKIIRSYLEAQWHLRAPRLTTEEFLRDLAAGSEVMAVPHRALLGDFLQHCDLAKFAGWRYSRPALAEMHASANDFVQQSSAVPAPASKAPNRPAAPRATTPHGKDLTNKV